MAIGIRRLSHALGAEITGVDIREPLSDNAFGEIHAAFLKYQVILFRGQRLTRKQHIAFSSRFGEPTKLTGVQLEDNDPEYPELLLLRNKFAAKGVGYTGSEIWHTDKSSTLSPPLGSLLRCVELPEVGGDTMFANTYLAYDTLSDGMKAMLAGLYGIHVGGGGTIDPSTPERLKKTMRDNLASQPLIRLHPETNRKSLYLGEKVRQLEGFTSTESAPILQFLSEHATRPQFVYRHVWQKDDLLIWDNRSTMHIAVNDYDTDQTRTMERVTIKGSASGHRYEGPIDFPVPGSEFLGR